MKNLILFFLIFTVFSNPVLAIELKHPSLVLQNSEGKKFNLKNRQGKITIINFWVSWCGNCRAEMENLKDLRNQYKELEIIGISVDTKKDHDDFLKVAKNLNYPNFIIYDAKINDFGEPALLPTTYVVDEKGEAFLVESARENLKQIIDDLM